MKRMFALAFAVPVTLLLSSGVQAEDAKPVAKDIDVALLLDVSGSMQGLIDSAKTKLWDIVDELARIKPTPNLRVALYSYGHQSHPAKDGYIRKELDLTGDLDLLYQKLFALRASGSVELVPQVCSNAVKDLDWSKKRDALKIIFVAGNETAQQGNMTLKTAADTAKERQVVINPIFCGNSKSGDAKTWIELAELAGGRFASIDQNRGTVAIATPMDKKIAALGKKLNTTYIPYGQAGKAKAENQVAQTANSAKLGTSVAALRAVAQNSALYRCADWDLIDRIKMDKKFDLTKLKEDQLPAIMRKMTPKERVEYVTKKRTQREAIQKEITKLNKERTQYIAEQRKKNPSSADRAFDEAIRQTLRKQAAERGITIPKEKE